MDVVRGSLREFGRMLNLLVGGMPDGDERPQPRRGPVWIVVQVAALALTIAVLFAVGGLLIGRPELAPETPAVRLAWALPGFVLALPLAVHWFAGPPRRAVGAVAAVAAGVVAGVAVVPLVAGWPALWGGLTAVTAGALVAAAVFGALAPCPAPARP